MNLRERVGGGRATAHIIHSRVIDGQTVVLHEETVHNVVTTAGRDFLHQQGYATSGLGANGLNYIALSNDTLTETTASTTLSNEIAVSGLSRAQGTVSHTVGTNTTTVSKVFTASGTVSAQKAALFTAASSGTMNHALAFTQRNLISGFAAATYTVTTPGSLPARITDNGVGVEAFVENFVAAGAASGTLTLNYLNAATGASKSGVIGTVVSAPVAGQVQPIPLAVGDTGVRQVTSAVNSATWTSGSFGITLAKPIIDISVPFAGPGEIYDWAEAALAKIPDDACLWGVWQPSATTATWVDSDLFVVDIG